MTPTYCPRCGDGPFLGDHGLAIHERSCTGHIEDERKFNRERRRRQRERIRKTEAAYREGLKPT